jgi:hypothetical protein
MQTHARWLPLCFVLLLTNAAPLFAAETLDSPTLLYPEAGAVLDNGCSDSCDKMERDFDWTDVAGADQYEIYVMGAHAQVPAIDRIVTDSSYSESVWAYVAGQNLEGWTWKVRAGNDATGWGEWSAERTFDVEDLNTDCTQFNELPHACMAEGSQFSGEIPFEVTFTARVTDIDGEIVAYRWDLDTDGITDTPIVGAPTITHVFTEPGYYTVQMVAVDDDGGTVQSSGVALATGSLPQDPSVLIVPAVVHARGAGGTVWRTDLSIINWSGSDSDLQIRFTSSFDGSVAIVNEILPAGSERHWNDVLVSAFGFAGDDEPRGVLRIESASQIVAQARTYNETSDGTFGQFFPAVRLDAGVSGNDVGVLQALRGNDRFRTNVGIVHLAGDGMCTAVVQLVDGGTIVGEPVRIHVAPGRYEQVNRVTEAAGLEEFDGGYAVVEVETQGCTIWSYASVVDEQTGDAMTSPQTNRP